MNYKFLLTYVWGGNIRLLMNERFQTGEKNFGRRILDKTLFGVSLITLPLGIYTAGTSLLAGEFFKGAAAFGFAFLDYTQIKEHGLPPEQQSKYNPERILNKIMSLGSKRFQHAPTQSMVYATA